MTRAEEIAFEKKAEKEFKGQRPLPNGRDFRWNQPYWHANAGDNQFRENFDRIFPNAPGAGI
jgi:hypothetical protein